MAPVVLQQREPRGAEEYRSRFGHVGPRRWSLSPVVLLATVDRLDRLHTGVRSCVGPAARRRSTTSCCGRFQDRNPKRAAVATWEHIAQAAAHYLQRGGFLPPRGERSWDGSSNTTWEQWLRTPAVRCGGSEGSQPGGRSASRGRDRAPGGRQGLGTRGSPGQGGCSAAGRQPRGRGSGGLAALGQEARDYPVQRVLAEQVAATVHRDFRSPSCSTNTARCRSSWSAPKAASGRKSPWPVTPRRSARPRPARTCPQPPPSLRVYCYRGKRSE